MTYEQQVEAIQQQGFTPRQARFLVLVMRHAGVCLDRHYCRFAGLIHGRTTTSFFETLVRRRFATPYRAGVNRAWIYHIHSKRLYRAIDDVDSRYRRPAYLGRAIERLMQLDAILAAPAGMTWCSHEREKLAHFLSRAHGVIDRDDCPALIFRGPTDTTVRYFPDRLPIGWDPDARLHLFLYLLLRPDLGRFRAFLRRHAQLLRLLPRWRLRLVLPRHDVVTADLHRQLVFQELASPLPASTAEELRWYFKQRRLPDPVRDARYLRAAAAFAAPRFKAVYRAWIREGDSVLDAARSPVIADALTRGAGLVETVVLPHSYRHLTGLLHVA